MGEQNEREAYNEAAREDYEGREREAMDRPLFTQCEVEAAIAAAVQAEREAILDALQQMRDAEGDEIDGRGYGLGLAQAVVKARLSPTIPTAGKWVFFEPTREWRFVVDDRIYAFAYETGYWYSSNQRPLIEGHAPDLESAKRAAVDALVRQGWYRETEPAVDVPLESETFIPCGKCHAAIAKRAASFERRIREEIAKENHPAVDVMARIRELESALKRTAMKQDADAREFAASECKRLGIGGTVALVAPRTAEESSGVET